MQISKESHFEEALLEKKVIAFKKLSVTEQTNILQSLYDVATMKSLSNATKRAEAYKQHLLKEKWMSKFEIGDKIEVIDSGKAYITDPAWAAWHGLKTTEIPLL